MKVMIESIKEEQEKDWGNFFSLKNLVIHPQLIRKSQTISSPYYSCFLKDIEIESINKKNSSLEDYFLKILKESELNV